MRAPEENGPAGPARLDRHALVLAIWLPLGLVALAGLRWGLGPGGWPWVLAGFGAALLAFALHLVANVALGEDFSAAEVAAGLALLGLGLVATALAALLGDLDRARLLALGGGLGGLALAAVLTLVTRFGARAAFDRFDVVRSVTPRPSSRLPHRGGRR